ncbi:unnamed protein product [[Actinomadura] parvosata subsp. kistnae]|uniref:RNA polymerase sigma-70 region 4 domain-containing protein n=1 Tax=[Actinomadura] parvosata subsp. kistnae TaxID=1909395 RepID=A0A1V0ABS2_9ACTN|nr:sigma-70 family RNA polymerase sigma factor [Nonomuraea sp. ATCC 55076]AQZ67654.1 hypothetical protein BKM31_44860 [Nonomuraea sp. ATCC 55076]SPL94058.1 unnamed protein product [Actinomadura parvosata subsp. kistnae]
MSVGIAHDLETVARTKQNLLLSIAAAYVERRADIEDAVQTAYLKALEKQSQGALLGDLVAFMAVWTRYMAMKTRPASDRPRPPLLVDFTAGYWESGYVSPRAFADHTWDPARHYEDDHGQGSAAEAHSQACRAKVTEALAILTPRERQAVQMHWVDGLSCSTVAETVGTTEAAVKSTIKRAARKIRVHFGESAHSARHVPVRRVDPQRLTDAARARAAEAARLLRDEKLTREQIGTRLGVSTRRVTVYLGDARALGILDATH